MRLAIGMSGNTACGGSGFGAVMGSKNIKAITVRGNGKINVAEPDKLKEINKEIYALTKGKILMDPSIGGIDLIKRSPCKGCPGGCPRGLYKHTSGREEILKNCQSVYFYNTLDSKYNDGNSSDNTFLATSLCNRLWICTQEMGNILRWMAKCIDGNILTEDKTGLPLSEIGSLEFIETLLGKITSREGFGDTLAEGTVRAAKALGKEAEKFLKGTVTKSGFNTNAYNPRYFITNAIFYATESTSTMNQLHEVCFPLMKWAMWFATDGAMTPFGTDVMRNISKKFWGGEKAVDFSTYKGKAKSAFMIQNREYAKENLVVCDFFFPITTADGSEDHTGDPTLESRTLSAVTGMDIDETGYYKTGERTFNLQRAIQIREGRRGREDDLIDEYNFTEPIEIEEGYFGMFNPDFMLPGPDGELITRKGAVVDRYKFSKMMDEYYELRGWDKTTGLQTKEKMEELGLEEIK